jgi:hypothetical protein
VGLDFVQFSTLSPYEGTPLHEQALIDGELAWSSARNPADAEERRPTLVPSDWREQDLSRILKVLYGGFYLRPEWMLKQAWRARRSGTFAPRARLGMRMLRWMGRLGS